MNISIVTIPHGFQRYDTCGDWKFTNEGHLEVKVSKTKEDYEFLVMIHELIEAYLCKKHGIDEAWVTKWDLTFKGKGEPGDAKGAPYRKEHKFATKIEKQLAKELGIDWSEYEHVIDSL